MSQDLQISNGRKLGRPITPRSPEPRSGKHAYRARPHIFPPPRICSSPKINPLGFSRCDTQYPSGFQGNGFCFQEEAMRTQYASHLMRLAPMAPPPPRTATGQGRENMRKCAGAAPARARTGRPRRALQERLGCPEVLSSDGSNPPRADAYVFPPHLPARFGPKFNDFQPDRRDFHRWVDPGTSRPA